MLKKTFNRPIMHAPKFSFILIITALIIISCEKSSDDGNDSEINIIQEETTGTYLDQTFPLTTPIRFAPEIFTNELHSPPIFSPDGTEVFWTWMSTEHRNIQYMKLIDGAWTKPTSIPFGFDEGSDSPFISSDGTKLVFTKGHFSSSENIYIVEKSNGEWMTPQALIIDGNQVDSHWQVSMADNKNIYFGSYPDVYFSKYENGEYSTAIKLGSMINTASVESSPFIAPDESYLIFDRIMSNQYADLFISFKKNDGSWGEAVNMEELNSEYHELYANVSPDGRFIMFLKSTWDGLMPFWVDASIIDSYRNE
jgi:WD40-like Beta Propeller Repeat